MSIFFIYDYKIYYYKVIFIYIIMKRTQLFIFIPTYKFLLADIMIINIEKSIIDGIYAQLSFPNEHISSIVFI